MLLPAELQVIAPLALAEHRARTLRNLRYELSLSVPPDTAVPVEGRVVVRFAIADATQPVVLDFAAPPDHVRSVSVGGRKSQHRAANGHIVIPAEELAPGEVRADVAVEDDRVDEALGEPDREEAHGDEDDAEERVQRAPPGDDPALAPGPRAVQRGAGAVERQPERRQQAGLAEDAHRRSVRTGPARRPGARP